METSMAFASANGTAMIEPAFNPAAADSPRCRQGSFKVARFETGAKKRVTEF
jgi:hypothetical protein